MRYVFAFIFCSLLFSLSAFPCEMVSPLRHTNPDGTQGGLVSKGAKVEAGVYIGFKARVCDQAWVDGNAKILDQATITENAWIRGFSVVRDRAVISGEAVVWGTQAALAEVGDDSRISGHAKILAGTKVSDRSQIYGSVSLEDSRVSGVAEVCEGHIIINQDITDDYFCNKDEVSSRIEISLESYKSNQFNKKLNRIKFKGKFFNFSSDRNIFQLLINGGALDVTKLDVRGDSIWVDVSNHQADGWNTFQLQGRDEYGKNFVTDEFRFFVGSLTKSISIQNSQNVPDPGMAFTAKYNMEGKEFLGEAKYKDGLVTLYGIPEGSYSYGISLEGVGDSTLLSEKFESIDEIPATANAYVLPAFVNNSGNFSQGLEGWKISHPQNIQVINENGDTSLEITGHESDRVEISKVFQLSRSQPGLSVNFVIPELNKIFLNDSSAKVKVILASMKRKALISRVYDASFTSENEKTFSIPTNSVDSKQVVLIRIEPGNALTDNYSKLRLKSASITSVFVDWTPVHLNYLNKANTTKVSTTNVPENDCEDPKYSMDKPTIEFSLDSAFNYFSAGQLNDLGGYISENRIWGSLTLSKSSSVTLHDIYLLGYQNDLEKFRTRLSTCAKRKLLEHQNSPYAVLSYEKSLVDYLFGVSFPIGLDTSPGSKVILTVAADVTINNKRMMVFGNEIEPTVLVASPVPQSRWYSYVDSYDENLQGILRTGGDKWVLPGYSDKISSLLSLNPSWGVNDISKINGGDFPGHESHNDGRDADFKFDPFDGLEFKLNCLNTDAKWKKVLDKIENFLVNSSGQFSVIESVFVTRDQVIPITPNNSCGNLDRKYMEKRFENRCIANRFVDFDMPLLSGSLLKHTPKHYDHIHVRYNLTQPDGQPLSNPPQIPADSYDLDKLWFQIVDDELVITPQTPSEFTNMVILWRYQDVEGYDSYDESVEFGKWVGGAPQVTSNKFVKPISKDMQDPIKHIYVTFGNNYNGGCRLRYVSIDLGLVTKAKRWRYEKNKSGHYDLVLEGVKI